MKDSTTAQQIFWCNGLPTISETVMLASVITSPSQTLNNWIKRNWLKLS